MIGKISQPYTWARVHQRDLFSERLGKGHLLHPQTCLHLRFLRILYTVLSPSTPVHKIRISYAKNNFLLKKTTKVEPAKASTVRSEFCVAPFKWRHIFMQYIIGFSFLFHITSWNIRVMLRKMATVQAFLSKRLTKSFDFSWLLQPVARALTSTEFLSKDYRQNCIKCESYALNLKENNCKLQLKRSSVQSL